MASPQKENGFTAIAHELLEALARIRINGEAMQILLFIIRKTYGFHKKQDEIALSQFVEATGIKKNSVCRAIEKLVQMKLIVVHHMVNKAKSYSINKDFDTWLPFTKRRTIIHQKVNKSFTKKGTTKDTTKYKRYNTAKAAKPRETFKIKISPQQMQTMVDLFEPLNPMYKWFFRNKSERNSLNRVVDQLGIEKTIGLIRALPEIVQKPYAPKITTPYQLFKDLGKLVLFFKQEKAKEESKGKEITSAENTITE